MNKDQEILAISRLVFELTLDSGMDAKLDALLARMFAVLESLPGLRILPKGAILLFNPRGALLQVAQYGLPPDWDSQRDVHELDGVCPDYREEAYLTDLATERGRPGAPDGTRVCVLPLPRNATPLGQVLIYVEPDWQPDAMEMRFMTDLGHAVSGLVSRCMVNETLRVREIELEEARAEAIRRLGTASEYRDNETGMHIMRMTNYAVVISKALGLPEAQREMLYITAPMHDVGKIGIADAILLKPGRLTSEEFEVMKAHTEIGAHILKGKDELIVAARQIAIHHHENWDGSGYPYGLKGEDIPMLARICAIADVFDALTSRRPYKQAWPLDEAVAWVRQEAGRKFDPAVVTAFDQALPEILRIRELYRDDIIDPNEVLELPPLPARRYHWIPWDESLRVGIDVIDEHHRYLFDLTNDLYDVVAEGRGSREVARVLKALDQYAQVHFQAEEKMMDHHGYSALDRQRHQHHHFNERLREFYAELHDNPLTTPFDVLTFLRGWLVRHIRHEDAQLASLVARPA